MTLLAQFLAAGQCFWYNVTTINKQLSQLVGDYSMKNTGVRFSDEEFRKLDELKSQLGMRSRNAVLSALLANAEVREVKTKTAIPILSKKNNGASVSQDERTIIAA